MKKKNLFIIGIIALLLIGATIGGTYLFKDKGENDKQQETSNNETDDEEIYGNANNKVTMYIFHGKECPTCQSTLEYFRSVVDDYDYLDIELFEVWHSDENQKLISEVEKELNLSIDYIPYMFIGANYHNSGFNKDLLIKEIKKANKDDNYQDIIKPILDSTEVKYEQEQLKSD